MASCFELSRFFLKGKMSMSGVKWTQEWAEVSQVWNERKSEQKLGQVCNERKSEQKLVRCEMNTRKRCRKQSRVLVLGPDKRRITQRMQDMLWAGGRDYEILNSNFWVSWAKHGRYIFNKKIYV